MKFKNYFQKSLLLTLLFIFPFFGFNQQIVINQAQFKGSKNELKTLKKEIQLGDKFFDAEKPAKLEFALKHYLEASKLLPQNAILNYKTGITYLKLNKAPEAKRHLEKAFTTDSLVATDILFDLGKACQLNYDFDQAIWYFTKYQDKMTDPNYRSQFLLANKHIVECVNAAKSIKMPGNAEVTNLGKSVNSKLNEDFALISGSENKVVFNAEYEKKVRKRKPLVTESRITFASIENDFQVKQPIPGEKTFKCAKFKSVAGISADGKTLIIKVDKNKGDLYFSNRNNGKWSKPKNPGNAINSKYAETSATLSSDGSTLYFVSNRPGGVGGKDIWMSKKNTDGSWGEPGNLGNVVNTTKDEYFVWLTADESSLYFCSAGFESMGGQDIFKTTRINGKWSAPTNLGFPVNSPFDETSITLDTAGEFGFISSNRTRGFGGSDIYKIRLPVSDKKFIFADGNPPTGKFGNIAALKGKVLDAASLTALKADIDVYNASGGKLIGRFNSKELTGEYFLNLPTGENLNIKFNSKGYLAQTERFYIPVDQSIKLVNSDIALRRLEKGARNIFTNILFDFGKSSLQPLAVPELIKIIDVLEQNPNVVLEIEGHCDAIGPNTYNLKLSGKRAKNVCNFLTASGIAQNRLSFKGKGEGFPVAPNKLPNGSDNPEGRKLNRRAEFVIIDF